MAEMALKQSLVSEELWKPTGLNLRKIQQIIVERCKFCCR